MSHLTDVYLAFEHRIKCLINASSLPRLFRSSTNVRHGSERPRETIASIEPHIYSEYYFDLERTVSRDRQVKVEGELVNMSRDQTKKRQTNKQKQEHIPCATLKAWFSVLAPLLSFSFFPL